MTDQEAVTGLTLVALEASLRAYAEQLPTVLSVPNLVSTITEAANTVAALVAERDAANEAKLLAEQDADTSREAGLDMTGQVIALEKSLAQAVAERDRYRDALRELVDAVEPKLGTMNYYFGPSARTAVSSDSVAEYRRISEAVKIARAALAVSA